MTKALTLLLALFIDLTLGDPPNRFHPVVLMGHWLQYGRKLAPNRYRYLFGLAWITAGLALFSLPWLRLAPAASPFTFLWQPLCLKPVFAYRNLRRRVAEVGAALAGDDLPLARHLLGWHLVSRDTSDLTPEEVAGAAIESLSENLTDSVTAPLLAYGLGGLPAAWGYRFANTADAMWGYHTPELEWLGKFAARLDDLLNWLPARLTGWLLVAAAWLAGEQVTGAAQTMLAQHARTPSPNAGWTMSAMAGALGVTLTKRGVYELAGGAAPVTPPTLHRAVRLADLSVGLGIGVLCAGLVVSSFIKRNCSRNLVFRHLRGTTSRSETAL
jgi:adenosylcobinamide-phosphate synthase